MNRLDYNVSPLKTVEHFGKFWKLLIYIILKLNYFIDSISYQNLSRNSVRIHGEDGKLWGSGAYVSVNIILTCSHVIDSIGKV